MLLFFKRLYVGLLLEHARKLLVEARDECGWVHRRFGWDAAQPNEAFVRQLTAEVAALQQRLNELN